MKKGFTLIELLSVVLIIAILTAVGLPQYRRVVQKARAAEAESMMRSIYDSSERLAGEFGYRSYDKLVAAKGSANYSFKRLDMFDAANLPANCSLRDDGQRLQCSKFDYKISVKDSSGNSYVAAKLKVKPEGVLLLLNRNENDLDLYCQGTEDQCDIFGLDPVTSTVSF
ncbi:MAG: prepilin-type N-terminal cleavage/methylation domain-containing protein [Elusimicrobiales bacterium]|nr:prepilin-type N-terminal cleavage/methylation domain-containing protein [Elusimicrobiales bacterium]